MPKRKLGAIPKSRGTEFLLWAPHRESVRLKLISPGDEVFEMKPEGDGYFGAFLKGVGRGARYIFVLDGDTERPDPASRSQPEGVHGPSEVIDNGAFPWDEGGWGGIPLKEYIIYEIHVGTFTGEGTFDSAASLIPHMKELGVTAVELMPVAQFPGGRNWGYDGAYPFAPQNTYGGPEGLKRFVERCHREGIAVILDVVFNHLGPEGNYLGDFAPYFTDSYRTPWGPAVNFDGPMSDHVRRYFIENALHWLSEYRMDALRLDAVHGIFDMSPRHILEEMKDEAKKLSRAAGRPLFLIAESDRNDSRLIRPKRAGGYGLDAIWNDDFHHALHVALTGESDGYYMDFGGPSDLAASLREGFVYSGKYSPYRKRRHGRASSDRPHDEFVAFSQNHDQIGNRMRGDRLAAGLQAEKLLLAAAAVLLGPYIPLVFMGEEYGEKSPFLYFVSHSDPALVEAVREGRKREFSGFGWKGEVPDPSAIETFELSKIDISLHGKDPWHAEMFEYYKNLIRLRKEIPALSDPSRKTMETNLKEGAITIVRRGGHGDDAFIGLNFSDKAVAVEPPGEGYVCVLGCGPSGGRNLELPPFGLCLLRKGPKGP